MMRNERFVEDSNPFSCRRTTHWTWLGRMYRIDIAHLQGVNIAPIRAEFRGSGDLLVGFEDADKHTDRKYYCCHGEDHS